MFLMQPLVFGCQGSKLAARGLFSKGAAGAQLLIDDLWFHPVSLTVVSFGLHSVNEPLGGGRGGDGAMWQQAALTVITEW